MKKFSIASFLLLMGLLFSVRITGAQHYPELNPPTIEQPGSKTIAARNGLLVAPAVATAEWTFHRTGDGLHPNGDEQEMVWLMNWARQNPTAEGIWLAIATDPDIAGGRDFFNVNLQILQSEFASIPPKPPAAFDVRLYNAAYNHSLELIRREAQDHDGQIQLVQAQGFQFSRVAVSVFSFAKNALNAHAALNIDWGPGDGTGMQPGRGHRKAIMAEDFDYSNVGAAVVPNSLPRTPDFGPRIVSINYALAQANGTDHFNQFIVGTVWQDSNDNDRYDSGEGFEGVMVVPNRGTYFAVTAAGGGYAIPVTDTGSISLTFSGGGIGADFTKSVTVGSQSVLVDYRVGETPAVVDLVQFALQQLIGRASATPLGLNTGSVEMKKNWVARGAQSGQ